MTFTTKNSLGIAALVFVLLLGIAATLNSKVRITTPDLCYSVYHIEQTLDLRVFLGEMQNARQIKIKNNLHIKEVLPLYDPDNDVLLTAKSTSKVKQYVMQIDPLESQINGASQLRKNRYQHPFLVTVDMHEGRLIDLQSTTEDQSVLKEYMAIFDFFQLSKQAGKYHYLNGNGRYIADITQPKNQPQQLFKHNLGYTHTEHKISMQKNEQVVTMGDSECFFQQSMGHESYEIIMSPKVFMQGEGHVTITAQTRQSWPASHKYHSLSSNITEWHSYTKPKPMTRELALTEINQMLIDLQKELSNKQKFISIIEHHSDSLPFFADYLTQNSTSEGLTSKLIWGLQRINTQASIGVLISIVASPAAEVTRQSAIQALARTSAKVNSNDLFKLQKLALEYSQKSELSDNEKLFINILGMMVNRRNLSPSDNIEQLKQFLIAQLEHSAGSVKIAYLQSISHFLTDIDEQAKTLLLAQLQSESEPMRLATAESLKKIPYEESFTKPVLKQLQQESQAEIKISLIQLLSHSNPEQVAVKSYLMDLLKRSSKGHDRAHILQTLQQVNYSLNSQDISLFKQVLTQESSTANQKLLASILLNNKTKI